jgi:hypothetical protein
MKRSPTKTMLFAVAAASYLTAGGIALAQDAPGGPPGPRSLIGLRCRDDAAKLCAGIEPGGGRLAKCLRGHEAELGEPCKAALAAGGPGAKPGAPAPAATPGAAPAPAKAPPEGGPRPPMGSPAEPGSMMGMRNSCAAEIGKFCKEVKPGHGRIAVCLNEHPGELSPRCKGLVDQVMQQMNAPMEMHKACAADAQKFCGELPPGKGRVAFCLGEHSADLSPGCKQHMAEMKSGGGKHGPGGRMGAGPSGAPPAPPPGAPVPPPPAPAK